MTPKTIFPHLKSSQLCIDVILQISFGRCEPRKFWQTGCKGHKATGPKPLLNTVKGKPTFHLNLEKKTTESPKVATCRRPSRPAPLPPARRLAYVKFHNTCRGADGTGASGDVMISFILS